MTSNISKYFSNVKKITDKLQMKARYLNDLLAKTNTIKVCLSYKSFEIHFRQDRLRENLLGQEYVPTRA